MTYQLIYSSQAKREMSIADLEQILVDARQGNEKHNITGALVYVDGVFLQILEGEEPTVRRLMESIAADTRHTDLKVFHEAEVAAPTFKSWRMAYVTPTPGQVAAWAGLAGTATIEAILAEIHAKPQVGSRVAENVLRALAS